MLYHSCIGRSLVSIASLVTLCVELTKIQTTNFLSLRDTVRRDVMTNQESVEMVLEALHANRETAFQVAAEWLTQEAYIRGSTDNIGVCVVAVI